MTVKELERTEVKLLAVLRRGVMDERDRAICEAVWEAWKAGRPASLREIRVRAGFSNHSMVHGRIHGYLYRGLRRGNGLLKRRWLIQAGGPETYRTLLPGPRFVGLDHGWPLEKVE